MSRRSDWISEQRQLAYKIKQAMEQSRALQEEYFANNYGDNTDGLQPVDFQGENANLEKADMIAMVTFAENFLKLMNNQAPAQADYKVTIYRALG